MDLAHDSLLVLIKIQTFKNNNRITFQLLPIFHNIEEISKNIKKLINNQKNIVIKP